MIVEFMENEVKVNKDDKDYQIASNFIKYNDLLIGDGFCEFERYEKAKNILEKNKGTLSEKQAMALLSDISIPEKTQWSAVYNINSLELSLCIHMKYDKTYIFHLN